MLVVLVGPKRPLQFEGRRHVLFSVLKAGNERLPLLDKKQKVRVKGVIRDITLDNVHLEPNAEYELL